MPFHEKSAWTMIVALLAGGMFYFWTVLTMSADLGELAPPSMPIVWTYTVILIVIAVLGHILAAAFAPEDADAPTDEREKRITERAGHLSGYILGFGALAALGIYLVTYNGDLMFYVLFASLMLSQVGEYAGQILLHRKGVY